MLSQLLLEVNGEGTMEQLETQLPVRVFVDGTHTLCSGKNSGIERVVRSIVREATSTASEIETHVVIAYDDKFVALKPRHIEALKKPAEMQRNVYSTLPSFYRWFATLFCRVIPLRTFRNWFLPGAGHLGVFKLTHSEFEKRTRRSVAESADPIAFQKGDVLLLPDAYWAKMRVWPVVEQARAQGAMVASLVYDLIPVTHEKFVSKGNKEAFLVYLRTLATHSDLIVAISETVRDQLREFLPTICAPDSFCEDIRAFPLGAELISKSEKPRSELTAVFDSVVSPYLMVATFEPRKNHNYLLDAFEVLWETEAEVRLCLIGRVGWLCDEMLERIQNHPRLDRELFVFHDVSDGELQYCYKTCRGVIFPSIVEGFGLPIVESLWHGQKTFASDTAIHREVGQNDCVYFDLDKPESLASQIVEWERQLANGRPALATRQPLTWQASWENLLATCLAAYRSTPTSVQS